MFYSASKKRLLIVLNISLVLLVYLFTALFSATAVAQNSGSEASLSPNKKRADVRVIIDVSGSMKQNDPNNLRGPALELLVKLLPDGSKAGVWTFGRYVNMLVPHREVNQEWRANALAKGKEINSTGLYTNIGEALEKSAYDAPSQNDDFETSIILLTDGMVDIDREPSLNQKEWRRIVDDVLPDLKSANYTLHTIALSDNADSELLNKLSIGTDGVASVAKTADELMKIFLAAFDNAAPSEQVPIKDNAFVVDSSVEEFTALIFTKPNSPAAILISPENNEFSAGSTDQYLNWYQSDQYELITVQKPIEGEWQVVADLDPDSRITIVSNLNLIVKPIKNNLDKNEIVNLSLLLSEDGQTITRTNFLELLDIHYLLVRQSDQKEFTSTLSEGRAPANGIYSTELNHFDWSDDYELNVVVDGKSFTREFTHRLSVREPFTLNHTNTIKDGKSHHTVSVSYYGDNLDLDKTKVAARIKSPQGKNSIQPFMLSETDTWEYEFVPDLEGRYEFAVRINAVDKNGGEFEVVPDILAFHYPETNNPFSSAEQPASAPTPQSEPEVVASPEPVAENTQPKEEASTEPDVSPIENADESDNKWLLYAALGVGNLLILVLAYFAYRMIMGKKKDPEMDELEQAVADLDKEEKGEESAKENDESSESTPPAMADVEEETKEESKEETSSDSSDPGEDTELVDEEDSASEGENLPEDLNIEADDDSNTDGDSAASATETDSSDENSEAADLGVSDVEFSLDDFNSEDSEKDGEEENKT